MHIACPGAYFLHDRRRLELLSRVASSTLRDYVQAAVGEREAVLGVIVSVQALGSVAHLHPHLHVLLTDGAFRRDGTFVPLPEPAVLEKLWRRAVLAEFVPRGWLEDDAPAGLLAWPHSGFGAYIGPHIEEHEGLLRVARYSVRAPVSESRLRYRAERAEVELVADRNDGPCAGVHRMTALEFLARWVEASRLHRRESSLTPWWAAFPLGSSRLARPPANRSIHIRDHTEVPWI